MKAVRGVVALALGLALGACADGPTGPVADQGIEASLVEMAGISGFATTALNAGTMGSHQGLFRAAVQKVRDEQGDEAARALVAPILEAARAARELRRAGDVDGFRAAMDDVHAAQADLIVQVLGEEVVKQVVQERLDAATARLATMEARIAAAAAAGRDVTLPQERLDAARAELAAAQKALVDGKYAEALLRAHFFGPRMQAGAGQGMGGGQRRRGG